MGVKDVNLNLFCNLTFFFFVNVGVSQQYIMQRAQVNQKEISLHPQLFLVLLSLSKHVVIARSKYRQLQHHDQQ